MSDSNPPKDAIHDGDHAADDAPRAESYEPPRIVWREPYEPLSFGLSCAKQPGNPACGPGPYSS